MSRTKDAMHQPASSAPARFAVRGRGGAGGRDLVRVTDRSPCPVCNRGTFCRVKVDGSEVWCSRVSDGAVTTLRNDLGESYVHRADGTSGRRWTPPPAPPPSTTERADAPDLDAAYRALLARLTIAAGDRDELLRRGLSAEDIARGMYRTLPDGWRERAPIARELVSIFGEGLARRVPGIVWNEGRDDPSRGWWGLAGWPGILIPCRDIAGRIVALKVRRRDPVPEDEARYTFVTSSNHRGPKALMEAHVPAVALALRGKVEPLVLTEGELKADVSTALSGLPVVSIPGVGKWQLGAELARQWGARSVAVALDADAHRKEDVARAQGALLAALRAEGLDARLWQWPEEQGKGLDDLLLRARRATETGAP